MKKSIYIIIALIIIVGIIVFVNKDSAVGPTVTQTAMDPDTYVNDTYKFSAHIPADYSVDDQYEHQVSPTLSTHGVKFTIPKSESEGTNLGSDSAVSVETIPNTANCTAELFTDYPNQKPDTVTDNDTTYSLLTTSDAGAGNRYEESIYAISGSNPCVAVRYFVHYSAIQNYPEGAVKEFDKAKLMSEFDAIRRSVKMK